MATGKKRAHHEADLQKECVQWLTSNGIRHVSIPNDVVLAGNAKQRAIQMANKKSLGLQPGFPDLFIFEMGSTERLHPELRVEKQTEMPCGLSVGGLAIELKVEGRKLRPEQAEWQQALRRNGYASVVVRSLEELKMYYDLHTGGQRRKVARITQSQQGSSNDPVVVPE